MKRPCRFTQLTKLAALVLHEDALTFADDLKDKDGLTEQELVEFDREPHLQLASNIRTALDVYAGLVEAKRMGDLRLLAGVHGIKCEISEDDEDILEFSKHGMKEGVHVTDEGYDYGGDIYNYKRTEDKSLVIGYFKGYFDAVEVFGV